MNTNVSKAGIQLKSQTTTKSKAPPIFLKAQTSFASGWHHWNGPAFINSDLHLWWIN